MMFREYKNRQRITCPVNLVKEESRRCMPAGHMACEKWCEQELESIFCLGKFKQFGMSRIWMH